MFNFAVNLVTDARGMPIRRPRHSYTRYIIWLTVLSTALACIGGALSGVALPNQVQDIVGAQWFTGADAKVDHQQLELLQQKVDAGAASPTSEEHRQLELLDGFNSERAQALTLISFIGAALVTVIGPLVGILADSTRSRLGRRAPWIVSGTLTAAFLLVALRFASSIAALAVVHTLMLVGANAALTALNATLADRVTEEKRAHASAFSGFGTFLGSLLGGLSAGLLFTALGLDFYYLLAIVVAVSGLLFVALAPDDSSRHKIVPQLSCRSVFQGLTEALRLRNFRWLFVSRALLMLGFSVPAALNFFMLQSYVEPALSQAEATAMAPVVALIGTPLTLLALLIVGVASDRLRRRKPFVVLASVIMALSMTVPIAVPSVVGILIQTALSFIAFGVYLPASQALFIECLPDTLNAGRDLGIAGLASNIGNALGPVFAGGIVVAAGGYSGVWIAGAGIAILSGVALLGLRNLA